VAELEAKLGEGERGWDESRRVEERAGEGTRSREVGRPPAAVGAVKPVCSWCGCLCCNGGHEVGRCPAAGPTLIRVGVQVVTLVPAPPWSGCAPQPSPCRCMASLHTPPRRGSARSAPNSSITAAARRGCHCSHPQREPARRPMRVRLGGAGTFRLVSPCPLAG